MTFSSCDWERISKNLEANKPAELAKMVQRLVREQGFLHTVFNTLQEGILVVDPSGVVSYANESAGRLLGFASKDVGVLPLQKIAPLLADYIHSGVAQDAAWSTREIEISYPQIRCLRVYATAFHSLDEFRDSVFVAFILNDITQEKEKAEALIEEEKLASVFMLAAGVAHEIGNPLNSLTIHLELLQRKLAKINSEYLDAVTVCQDEVARLDNIIKHFLKALKPVNPDFQEVNILEILASVLAVQKAQMESLGVQVELDLAQPLPSISADKALLKQVFFNLVKNALEAMDRGGRLSVRAHCLDEALLIDIEDNGVGMDSVALAHVFTPFYTTKPSGHGLGLILVQRILRAHRGSLSIHSRPTQGTCMTVQLPLKQRLMRFLEKA